MDEFDERVIVPCCGLPQCYCECTPSQRDLALLMRAIEEDECPPAPPLPPDHPWRNVPPPF